jgi:hypothetical protein
MWSDVEELSSADWTGFGYVSNSQLRQLLMGIRTQSNTAIFRRKIGYSIRIRIDCSWMMPGVA